MAFTFYHHYTDPATSPFWDDSFEEIVQSYPEDQQARVRDDLLNGKNGEKYGVRWRLVSTGRFDDFSQLLHGDGEIESDEQKKQGEND